MRTAIICFFFLISKTLFADPCAFCNPEVLEKQSVFESTYYRVLIDYAPDVKGHLLVIPKRHIVKAHELSKEEWEDLSIIIPKIASVFSKYPGTDQYIVLEKNGPTAFQHVPHVHFHLLPIISRWKLLVGALTPTHLNDEELEKEVSLFRDYFSK